MVTSMGHLWAGDTQMDSLHCAGFQTILCRGVEYVATGAVTLDVPATFPSETETTIVPPHRMPWSGRVEAKDRTDWKAKKEQSVFAKLDVKESREAFELAEGYEISAVASEPDLEEPVVVVWDGNGVMYVAEMRSYMQDVEGTGTKTLRNGRVKRLEDTNGDGSYDRVTVFIDKLNLPRMLLPLDDRLAVVETDTTSVFSYRDIDGDGVADKKVPLWNGREIPATKSVEHQDSGLIWNIDNNIYVSYGHTRYRFTDGTWTGVRGEGLWAQWGLDFDETGQIFYSTNSEPFFSSQMPREYWGLIRHRGGTMPRDPEPVSYGKPYDLSFLEMKNLCETDDRGPNNRPRRGMTSAGGQSLYKGTSLPIADRGSFFITDPTAHVVRRGLVTDQRGRRFLTHPHGEEEWLISPDVYFRPVNTTMGPDGAVYVVDMARGVIQDAPWLSPGPREYIRETGLEKVVRRGRIWRVSHRDHPWDGRQPRMLEESTAELVRHLSGPNGWWRLTAQRMIILREDRESVKPLLEDVVRYSQNPLGRLHALWTLEGCGLHQEVLTEALQDRDWRVRAAAIRMHEPMIKDGDASTIEHLSKLTGDAHPEVAKQLILSLGWTKDEAVFDLIGKAIERHPGHLGVTLAGSVALWKQETPTIAKLRSGEAFKGIRKENERNLAAAAWKEALAQWERGSEIGPEVAKEEVRRMQSGETLYFQSCVACHGADGKGIRIEGMEMAMAPPLAGSKRVTGPLDQLMPVLMNGMEGPVDGKSYQAGFMAPVHSLGITRDDRLAELVSYIRHAWGNKAPAVSKDEVKGWRKKLQHRKTPWTEKELSAMSEE
ncbi:MAG: HEAT repeat domain-containing protein, partial [Verrucomicrobiota bacterium]